MTCKWEMDDSGSYVKWSSPDSRHKITCFLSYADPRNLSFMCVYMHVDGTKGYITKKGILRGENEVIMVDCEGDKSN